MLKLEWPKGSNGFAYLLWNDVNIASAYNLQDEKESFAMADLIVTLNPKLNRDEVKNWIQKKAIALDAIASLADVKCPFDEESKPMTCADSEVEDESDDAGREAS